MFNKNFITFPTPISTPGAYRAQGQEARAPKPQLGGTGGTPPLGCLCLLMLLQFIFISLMEICQLKQIFVKTGKTIKRIYQILLEISQNFLMVPRSILKLNKSSSKFLNILQNFLKNFFNIPILFAEINQILLKSFKFSQDFLKIYKFLKIFLKFAQFFF